MKKFKGSYSIEILSEKIDVYKKIIFKGRLVYTTIQDAKKHVYPILEDGKGYIIDMQDIEQIDSTGFGVLVNMGKKIIKDKKNMVIIVKDELIRELFEISKIDLVFPVVKTHEEALALLESGSITTSLKIQRY